MFPTLESSFVEPARWLTAVAAGASVPLLLALLLAAFPALGDLPVFDGHGRAFSPFGAHQPLPERVRTFQAGTSVVFWGACIVAMRRPLPRVLNRRRVAAGLTWCATACLCFVMPLLVMAWTLAGLDGYLPDGPWGVKNGNHGPWRPVPGLRHALWMVLSLPVVAGALGAMAWLARPAWRTAAVAALSVLAFYLLMGSHYWLID
ncbi:MAG: hypothetical protein ACE5FQ_12360 [Thiogranum sp.]